MLEKRRRPVRLDLGGHRLGLPGGQGHGFHDVVALHFVLALLVQKDHLLGREPQQPLLGQAVSRRGDGERR